MVQIALWVRTSYLWCTYYHGGGALSYLTILCNFCALSVLKVVMPNVKVIIDAVRGSITCGALSVLIVVITPRCVVLPIYRRQLKLTGDRKETER